DATLNNASAWNLASSGRTAVTAIVQSGNGGDASGPTGAANWGGQIQVMGPVSARPSAGDAEVSLTAIGGSGGHGYLGAKGGNGAEVFLGPAQVENAVNGKVTQIAIGGNGGGSDGNTVGTAGRASSTLIALVATNSEATAIAQGGN